MNKSEWKKGLDEWTRVKLQAQINVEQADLYIAAIKDKINSLSDDKEETIKNGR